ncbi:MAG: RluA family pseudouridine synthase [Planctomycetota bacterium]|jgi:tRNA pseudouridine65 synthase
MSAPLEVLHLDEQLVVVNKPSGIAVHRGERSEDGEEFILQRLKNQIDRYLYPVHRLDRGTSGVLSFALSKPAAAALQASLRAESARKEYLCLVRGSTAERFTCDRPLTSEEGQRQAALSHFEKLGEFYRCSLLRARIETGRRHQIRRHLQHEAHQIIGDSSYGKGRINKWFRDKHGLPRMFLHAERLSIEHPESGEACSWHAPLPDDLREFLLGLPEIDSALVARL